MRVRLDSSLPAFPAHSAPAAPARTGSFGAELDLAVRRLEFSRHAQRRIERRDLQLDPARGARLANAVESAAAKGARQAVVVLDELAFVVDVRQRTVVTALNHREGGAERVFTNIDSVVIA
ncbi:hypothetical protein HRbin29_01103 [bacterium HR29]|jgi:flagellar operon protein|nr:hypothetical protein HRbin29_01103 [bacterium HR29]